MDCGWGGWRAVRTRVEVEVAVERGERGVIR